MDKELYDSQHPNVFLTDKQRSFLNHILFHHQGIGHPLAIGRILDNGTYHYKKDIELLNNLKGMYLMMACGRAEDLEEEYGMVTDDNKYRSDRKITKEQLASIECDRLAIEDKVRKEARVADDTFKEIHRKQMLDENRALIEEEIRNEQVRLEAAKKQVDEEAKRAMEGVDVDDIRKLLNNASNYLSGKYRK